MEESTKSKVLDVFKKYKGKNSFATKEAALAWLTSPESDPGKLFSDSTLEFCKKFTELKRNLMEFIEFVEIPDNIGDNETIEFIYAPAGIAMVRCKYDLSSMDEGDIAMSMDGAIMPCDYEMIEFIARAEFPYDVTPRVFEKKFGYTKAEQENLGLVFWASERDPYDGQIIAYNRAVMYMPLHEILVGG